MRGIAKIGVGTVLMLAAALPAGAAGAVLYEQTSIAGPPSSTPSMSYASPNDVQAADDFTVPAGQTWTVNEVDVLGYGPTNLKTDVYFYADAGGLPGAELFDQDAIAATNGPNYNSPLSGGPTLGPGTYWVSVLVNDFWSWDNSNSLHGNPAAWRNPTGGFAGTDCKAWVARSSCFVSTATEPDQAFRLIGPDPVTVPGPGSSKPSNAFAFGALKLDKKKGSGELTVTVPGAGSLALSGIGLKPTVTAVAAAGDVKLTLKASGKAKKKLKKKGKAKLEASVVFTPTGGDPATQVKKVTLKKKKKTPPKK